jgi:DedD protein
MGLLSYFKRKSETSAEAPRQAEPDAVAAARTRARRRLIGAAVLLGVGVIGFPLLFETQPRPISVNIPIEIPRKDGLAPLLLPPVAPPLSPTAAVQPNPAAAMPASPGKPAVDIVEQASDQGRELASPAPAPAPAPAPPAPAPAPRPAPAPVEAAVKESLPAPVEPASKAAPGATKPSDEGARARALLEGQPVASAPGVRLVVQVGAYAEASKLAEARQRVEKLGLKTYTQVVEVGGAKRTRVRVGPFVTRADADKAAARIKAVGLPVAILTL